MAENTSGKPTLLSIWIVQIQLDKTSKKINKIIFIPISFAYFFLALAWN